MTTREQFDKFFYKDLLAYTELTEGDQIFFDKLFPILIYQGNITWSNEKLASVLSEKISTLEKRLKRLEQSTLIIREVSRLCEYGVWRTVERVISLNPLIFPFDFNSMGYRIFCDYLFHQKTKKILDKYLEMDYPDFVKAFGSIEVVKI